VAVVGAARAAGVAAAAEHLEVVADDLGLVALLAAVAIFPGARLQASLDVHLLTLGEVLPGGLRLAPPHDDVVPLGLFLPVAVLVLPASAGGEREARDGLPVGGGADLGIAAQVADQDHFVDHAALLVVCAVGRAKRAFRLGSKLAEAIIATARRPAAA